MTELTPFREQYSAGKAGVIAALAGSGASTRGIHGLLQKLGQLTDNTLRHLWQLAEFPPDACLIAVGGFGRGELFPHSDVDVLLLLPDDSVDVEDNPALKAKVEGFISSCWDCGLHIGSSVRTAAHCVEEATKDVTVQTSLLEMRLVTGSAEGYQRLQAQLDAILDPKAFFIAKTLEMRQRHNKFDNTPYALEPNCKESPGGLRDLQVVLWVARAAGLGKSWDELAKNGLVTTFEVRQIKANEALLSLIRARLHIIAGRREDRLVFDLQTAVAESFGYCAQSGNRGERTPALDAAQVVLPLDRAVSPRGGRAARRPPARPSEALMRRYYWTAKAVTQLNQILLLNIEEQLSPCNYPLRPLNERFFDKAGMLEVVSDDLYLREPHAILETFLLFATHVGIRGLSARTLRALYNARGMMNAKFRTDPVNRATFLRILQQPQGITHAMRLMNQTSVLGRYLWVFRGIVGQMQHDLFHVYTVDQHILMVLRNMRRFFMAEHSHEYPMCSQLAAGWDKPWILYIAALFHDIAKGRGGDHSELGQKEVRIFCRQHGIAAEDTRLIEFLVGEHLSMSRVAQKEDLSNPAVIAAFARRVGNERYLTALYLLTVADIRGTSPKVWNAWKGKLLEDLYRYTLRVLGGRAPDAAAEIEARKRGALTLLALHAEPFQAYKALWDTLDVSYFMRHEAADIAWHARHLSRHIGKAVVTVRVRQSATGEGMQVLVYTPDAPDLFVRICGFFDKAGFSILDAKVHTTNNGFALDTFQVTSEPLEEHYRELATMVEVNLGRILEEKGPLPPPSKGRVSRRVKSFPVTPRVDLRPDEKAQRWLLSVSASDRVGLLYLIARVLANHHINVKLAKVTTLGERVEDTFLIDGPELQHNKAQIAIETELLKALSD
ncbi:[protein-PII] uridylyltransferase [Polaromonas sp.]|uniref:[protein-PII] uridylyltransferase n=1 Tax=Polaromonas sp. TaxID=1869339 RepID=UPI0013B74D8D|nr:[protein-PII] uridylyltransferase [Polaromonas sp.]NDP61638.1 [protein-PII] uridylyltransferase [Polaromonas sp.]